MDSPPPEQGTAPIETVGRYQIVGRLAVGGMAEVLLGKLVGPSSFERAVVIKRILPHLARQASFVRMFLDEARIAARIRHANVVGVHDLGQDGEQLYLVMEYLEGESADALLRHLSSRGWTLSPLICAHVVAEACAGLHAAHELADDEGRPQQLVHRDVSPQNVFITYDGQVRILDFGIAKVADRVSMTEAGFRKGRWAYMSPEQIRGEALDRRSDVFSLGVVLYELSTCRRLFSRSSEEATARVLEAQPIVPPSRVVAGYPSWLEPIVLRALAQRPEDRFQTAAEMRRKLLVSIHGASPPEGFGEALADVMRSVFAERVAQKAEMLRSVRSGARLAPIPQEERAPDVPIVVEDVSVSAVTAQTTPMVVEVPRPSPLPPGREAPRRRRARWLVMLCGFVAAAALAYSWSVGSLQVVGLPARGEPPTARVTVRVDSSPPGATVLVDGATHGKTPTDVLLPRSERRSILVLRLAGYRDRTERIAPDGDLTLRFDLQAVAPPAPPAPPSPTSP